METDDPLSAIGAISGIISNPPDLKTVIGLIILLILLILSALMSGSEVAFFSLSPADLGKLKSSRSKRAASALKLHNNPEKLLSTILVANNFINVSIIILAAFISSSVFDFSSSPVLGFIIEVIVITFLLVLFGEVLPKVYASHNQLGFALFMCPYLKLAYYIFKPVASILVMSTSFIRKRTATIQKGLSMTDLSDALNLPSVSTGEDEKILKGIVKFGNISVSAIMTPRVDVMALNIKWGFSEILPLIYESGFSRIPVYSESFDNVRGILYVKDILPHTDKPATFRWQSLIRPPYFVPETKKINDLLKEFQVKKIHMAVVIDEYGGTSGIITLEDILEEIVGEITDETDDEEVTYRKDTENSWLFQGKTLLNDFCKILEIEGDPFEYVRGDSETLAGLLLELTGEIPPKDQTVTLGRFLFTVTSADRRRIKEIKVTLLDEKGNIKS
ncbi:MAG: gliding motility-associated protein GldE [Bacteroidales bacterium]|nr:gliding motility-associated protein GldE [Bacteroidales bacterium]